MSVEEDTELRDLVSQTLENNGVLAKIRAELRASIFLALEEQENTQVKTPFVNKPLKEYLSTPEGALGLCLVREFLEYLELDFTLSVFNSETHHGKGYEYSDRNKLMKDLHLTNINGKKGPLLAHMLQVAQQTKTMFSGKEENDNSIDSCKDSTGDTTNLNSSVELQEKQVDTPNSSVAPLDQTFVAESALPSKVSDPAVGISDSESEERAKKVPPQHLIQQAPRPQQAPPPQPERLQSLLQPGNQNHVTVNNKSHNNSDMKSGSASSTTFISKERGATKSVELSSNSRASGDTSKKDSGSRSREKERWPLGQGLASSNMLTSLSNLPPLEGQSQIRKEVPDTQSLLSVFRNLESSDNYEEDFQSTDSSTVAADRSSNHQPSKGSKTSKKDVKDALEKDMSDKGTNSPVGSISEEIDDTNSGIDELLNSTASGENTVDATMSTVTSQFADYMEDV